MLEPAVMLLRLAQFGGAMILFGSSLFFIYSLPAQGPFSAGSLGWPRPLVAWAAVLILIASALGLIVQTSVMAGSISEGLKLDSIEAVITSMAMGPATLIRMGAALAAAALLALRKPDRFSWAACAVLGAIVCGSFAWMGHGAATQDSGHLVHLISDILHVLAAALWIGALVAFLSLLRKAPNQPLEAHRMIHRALQGFAGVGSGIVATLILTGLINSWYLVTPSRLAGLWTTPYGWLLVTKLAVFGVMLALAAANRFRLTPALGQDLAEPRSSERSLEHLKRSLIFETAAAFAVLGLVSVLGTLAPISAV